MALKPLSLERRHRNVEWIKGRFHELADQSFYGTVEVSVQNGIPVQLKIHVTEKPPEEVVGNPKPRL